MSRDRDAHGADPGRPIPARLDPRGGRPTRSRGSTASGAGGAGPRRPAHRGVRAAVAARAVAGVLSLALLAGSGWGWYLVRVADAGVNRTDAIPAEGNDGLGDAMNLLLVGNDSRAGATPEELEQLNTEDTGTQNTDTMILVHVPSDGSEASFVSFPRDSLVEIPGRGRDKLNAAYAYGYGEPGADAPEAERRAAGSQLLIRTISQLSGQQIDHYVEVDLLGFFNLTSVVGGVTVNLCSAVQDPFSGADFPAGEQALAGEDALAFVRQRQGVRPDGSPALPRGDLDRIVRQQVFIGGVLRQMLSQDVLLDLGKQRELIQAASESLTIDRDLDLLDLAQQMQSVTPGDIRFQTVPVVDADDRDEEGRSIVRLADGETLRAFFAGLSAEPEAPDEAPDEAPPSTPAPVAPSEVQVEVYNGSGVAGLATQTETALEAAGFPVTATGNADRSDYERTTIRHAAGDEALAGTLAAQIPGAVTEVSEDATAGTVQLVLGTDFTGLGEPTTPTTSPTGPADPGTSPEPARTAADTSCIN